MKQKSRAALLFVAILLAGCAIDPRSMEDPIGALAAISRCLEQGGGGAWAILGPALACR